MKISQSAIDEVRAVREADDAKEAAQRRRQAVQELLAAHREEGEQATAYGISLDDLTREELLGVVSMLLKDLQVERESHRGIVDLLSLRPFGDRPHRERDQRARH